MNNLNKSNNANPQKTINKKINFQHPTFIINVNNHNCQANYNSIRKIHSSNYLNNNNKLSNNINYRKRTIIIRKKQNNKNINNISLNHKNINLDNEKTKIDSNKIFKTIDNKDYTYTQMISDNSDNSINYKRIRERSKSSNRNSFSNTISDLNKNLFKKKFDNRNILRKNKILFSASDKYGKETNNYNQRSFFADNYLRKINNSFKRDIVNNNKILENISEINKTINLKEIEYNQKYQRNKINNLSAFPNIKSKKKYNSFNNTFYNNNTITFNELKNIENFANN
jgi:hypothetical protein